MTARDKGATRTKRPWPIRWMNAAGHAWAHDGRDWVSLDAATLIRDAEQATGLSDWGPEPLDEPLKRLVQSLNEEAQLNLTGRLMLRSNLRRQLTTRLKLQRDWKQHPEILDEKIERPLFIVGLPRTGSTLLQRLLARDPSVRSLQTWEMMLPSPPPTEETAHNDPRIKLIDRNLRFLYWAAPEVTIAHEVAAGEPEECVSLMQNSLMSPAYELMCNLPSYRAWVDAQDPMLSYSYYRKQLQLLQWKYRRDHWVLKSPFHLMGLNAILKLFPDAVIVQTHREPVQVVPSLCSLFAAIHQLTSDRCDPLELGPRWLARLTDANDRTIALRDRIGDERFVDVSFRDMVQDPFTVLRGIYARFNYPLSDAALQGMQQWQLANPQHKHGVHHYTPEQFGLTTEEVEQRFALYRERFQAYL